MPQRKPPPPESADMAGTASVTEGRDGDVALFPQHITSCFPLASMAQKTSSSPNDAEIGPMAPNPCAAPQRNGRKKRRERVCMVRLGWEQCHGLLDVTLGIIIMLFVFVFVFARQVRTINNEESCWWPVFTMLGKESSVYLNIGLPEKEMGPVDSSKKECECPLGNEQDSQLPNPSQYIGER
ncbi:hypothetical protein CR513_54017, partial [Mucuna pruriens]